MMLKKTNKEGNRFIFLDVGNKTRPAFVYAGSAILRHAAVVTAIDRIEEELVALGNQSVAISFGLAQLPAREVAGHALPERG
jgi:hypothetical protein